MKPLLVYDGACRFCRYWVARWSHRNGGNGVAVPYQALREGATPVSHDDYAHAVHLIDSGKVYRGAEAVLRYRSLSRRSAMLWLYLSAPLLAWGWERGYAAIAKRRGIATWVTRLCWGLEFEPPSYLRSRWIFLRGLGLIYAAAFLSLSVQIRGLVGENGILPLEPYLQAVRRHFGDSAYWDFPTVFWWSSGDGALTAACWAGVVVSLLVVAGFLTPVMLALAWFLYLSLVNAGQEFLSFQWDVLLLETGFIAIFLAPMTITPKLAANRPPANIVRFLLAWLLFRLMFSSGIVKLDDETWRNLTALFYHYETQPLPTRLGWFVHHLPISFHKFSVVVMFFVELAVPFLIFAPRRIRHAAGAALLCLQVLILLSGNYCFFNLLSIALVALLFDDQSIRRIARNRYARPIRSETPRTRYVTLMVHYPVATLLLVLGSLQIYLLFFPPSSVPDAIWNSQSKVQALHLVNGYGLFAHMTTSRPEIVVEGSNDRETWKPYVFRWKPGPLDEPPRLVAPHQPRLDWQMWFAALGGPQRTRWFPNFLYRLLQNEPVVVDLLEENPFPDEPPKYVRALLYDYRFSSWDTWRETGRWWRRNTNPAVYTQPMALR